MTTSTTSTKPLIDLFVSVVLPCHNGEDMIADVVLKTHSILRERYSFYEIIVVDDASTDQSRERLDPVLKKIDGVRVICLSRPHDLDVAASAGVDSSIGDCTVVLSPSTDNPDDIPALVDLVRQKNVIIYGVPTSGVSRHWLGRILSVFFNWYCKKFLHIDIQRGSSLMRAMNRATANAFTQSKDTRRSLRLITASLRHPSVAYSYKPITNQKTKRTFWQDVDTAFDIIVSISANPMRLLSRLSISVAFLSLLYNIYVIGIYFFKKDVAPGWVTLSFEMSCMFFLLFMLFAVFSEYLGKIMSDNRRSEPYSVVDEKNSSIMVDAESRLNVYKET